MQANLVLLAKNGEQKVIPVPSTVTVIGRRRNCDLRIPLDSVSRRHCQLAFDNGSLKVRDLGSRNGTFVNGKRVDEHTAVPGDYLQIGSVLFALQINGQPEKVGAPAPKPGTSKASAPKAPPEAELDGPGEDLESGLSEGLDDIRVSAEELESL